MRTAASGRAEAGAVFSPLVSPAASEEYYQLLLSGESQACGASLPCYTAEDIEGATSEFIVKNAVSAPLEWSLPPCPPKAEPLIQVSRLSHCRVLGGQEISSSLQRKTRSSERFRSGSCSTLLQLSVRLSFFHGDSAPCRVRVSVSPTWYLNSAPETPTLMRF